MIANANDRMRPSYELVNYTLRPRKCIERKMLCEAFRRLSEFGSLSAYRYVGLGSIYFSDFGLVHKSLGIKSMVSIENQVQDKERFDFNRPYKCISIEWGESTDVLARLSWNTRTILWLDYDRRLDAAKLADISFFCTAAKSGSVVVVTVNAEELPVDARAGESKVASLTRAVGSENVPIDIEDKNLEGWGVARVYRRIMGNRIRKVLLDRNGALPDCDKLEYKQIFNFEYADRAKMLTIGGVLFDKGDRPKMSKCDFEELRFCRTGEEACRIDPPILTLREVRHVDTQLPCTGGSHVKCPGVLDADLDRYAEVYRYYPSFAEAEL
jgi:hypothetical protein